jgi:hypothetical protein
MAVGSPLFYFSCPGDCFWLAIVKKKQRGLCYFLKEISPEK